MRIPGIRIECLIAILRQNAYMHEQITKGFGKMNTCISRFGIRIGDRKFLKQNYNKFTCHILMEATLLVGKNYLIMHYHGLFAYLSAFIWTIVLKKCAHFTNVLSTMLSARGNAYLLDRENEWCHSEILLQYRRFHMGKMVLMVKICQKYFTLKVWLTFLPPQSKTYTFYVWGLMGPQRWS